MASSITCRRGGRPLLSMIANIIAEARLSAEPIIPLLSEGQMSDHKGARLVLDALPAAIHLIADRGYDSTSVRKIS